MALAAIYVVAMLASNVVARREVASGLARAGRPADTRFMVTPVVVNPFRREVVIDVGDRYEKGNLWFDPRPHFRPAGFGIEKGLDNPDVQPALQTAAGARLPALVAIPVRAGRSVSAARGIWINDYRYANAAHVRLVCGQAAVSSVR